MNYYAYEYDQLRAMVLSGDAGTIRDMARRWKAAQKELEERGTALYDLLGKLDDAWEGEAAETFKDPMYRLAITCNIAASRAKTNWDALESAADGLTAAQSSLPEPTSVQASRGSDAVAELRGQWARQQEYEAYQQDKQAMIDRLNKIDTAYADSADKIKDPPTYDGPPPKQLSREQETRIGEGSSTGSGAAVRADSYGGSVGGSAYSGTGSGGSGGGGGTVSGGYGGGPTAPGGSNYSGGTGLASGGVIGAPTAPGAPGGVPGGTPGGPALPGTGAPGLGGLGGGVVGGAALPGAGAGARGMPLAGRGGVMGGGALPGGYGGANGGPGGAAAGRTGTVTGRIGPGGVLGSGGPGSGTTGTAGRGGTPMGMGAAGAGGQGGDRRRTTWLQETEDVWHGEQEAAPPVLGDDPSER